MLVYICCNHGYGMKCETCCKYNKIDLYNYKTLVTFLYFEKQLLFIMTVLENEKKSNQ